VKEGVSIKKIIELFVDFLHIEFQIQKILNKRVILELRVSHSILDLLKRFPQELEKLITRLKKLALKQYRLFEFSIVPLDDQLVAIIYGRGHLRERLPTEENSEYDRSECENLSLSSVIGFDSLIYFEGPIIHCANRVFEDIRKL